MAHPRHRVALLADNHFHDVYAPLGASFPGLVGSDGRRATIRTMAAQLTSTRLFNEGYFALRAALDDVVARGIRWVVLDGDFSDEGQPVHVRGLVRILEEYRGRGLEFFATFGNHDPVSPLSRPDGKADFLGRGGLPQGVWSPGTPEAVSSSGPLDPVFTDEVLCWGYGELWDALGPYGIRPQPQYEYWETPYSSYEGTGYSWERAWAESDPGSRQCAVGEGFLVPDATYMVEPTPGLWLVGVDANVYLPRPGADPARVSAASFLGSGEAGWNQMLVHKAHVVEWLRRVVLRARAQGKALVTFSHYPMVEFYRGGGPTIAALFGPRGLDLPRSPRPETSRALASLGLGVHFGGHLHINDTAVYRGDEGVLVNVQIPSLAAYVPGYKVASVEGARVDVDTVVVRDVPGFNALFEHYEDEHRALVASGAPVVWDRAILSARDYREFASGHLRELVRLRFLPRNWPPEVRGLLGLSLAELVPLAFLETRFTCAEVQGLPHLPRALSVAAAAPGTGAVSVSETARTLLLGAWDAACVLATRAFAAEGLDGQALEDQPAFELAVDLHRVLAAGHLSHDDVAPRRGLYRVLKKALTGRGPEPVVHEGRVSVDSVVTAVVQHRLALVVRLIDPETHTVIPRSP